MWEWTRPTYRGLRGSELERLWLEEKQVFDELPWYGHMRYVVPMYDNYQHPIMDDELHVNDKAMEALFADLCTVEFVLYYPYYLSLEKNQVL